MWEYNQASGELKRDGERIGLGYSGAQPDGYNRPEMERVHNVGPLPRGRWTIAGPPIDTMTHGPYVLRLEASAETETFGRSGFLIHGDSVVNPGHASEGCLILAHYVRELIWESGDRDLLVTG